MIQRLIDWRDLRGSKQKRIRMSAARAATKGMVKRHKKDREELYEEMRVIQEEVNRRSKELDERERALDAREELLRQEQDDLVQTIGILRGAFKEWMFVLEFFKHNTGKLFASYDKLEVLLDQVQLSRDRKKRGTRRK